MAPPCVVFFLIFFFCLPCVLDQGAWQGVGIAVRFLPAHGKGRNVHAVWCGRRQLLFFAMRLPITHDKDYLLCVVRHGA
jgi:hypothetical protein